MPVRGFDGEFFEYDATGKNSGQAGKDLVQKLDRLEVNGKVVIIRLKGELSGGRTGDIDSSEMRRNLASRGAVYVQFNRFGLTTKEYEGNRRSGEDIPSVETNLFRENIGSIKVTQPHLKGTQGVESAKELLRNLRQQQKAGETKLDYEGRIVASGIETLGIAKELGPG